VSPDDQEAVAGRDHHIGVVEAPFEEAHRTGAYFVLHPRPGLAGAGDDLGQVDEVHLRGVEAAIACRRLAQALRHFSKEVVA
jgi:hypothetical protein